MFKFIKYESANHFINQKFKKKKLTENNQQKV